jgi:hypothetical protein
MPTAIFSPLNPGVRRDGCDWFVTHPSVCALTKNEFYTGFYQQAFSKITAKDAVGYFDSCGYAII